MTTLQHLLDRLDTRYGRKAAEYASFHIEAQDYAELVGRLRAVAELAEGWSVTSAGDPGLAAYVVMCRILTALDGPS